MMSKTKITIGAVALLAGAVIVAVAGPLNPPAGPVAPTYRTLDEVDGRRALSEANTPGTPGAVYRITQSGAYFLTGDVTVGQGQSAIEIAARDVTIDLNGYTLIGESLFTTTSGNGIVRAAGTQPGVVTIRDGTIRAFDGDGIAFGSSGDRLTVERVHATACGRGIVVDSYATAPPHRASPTASLRSPCSRSPPA